MSYLVFARKYRPQQFDDVVGQQHVTRTLSNAIANDRVGSGYLFCGPRGTGKTTTARILARAINCADGPTPTPCGKCPACKEIAGGNALDVLEIDAASNTGVDDVRTLRENVRYLPTHGRKRIYIIDEVHRLSGAAFDALLKTLEEPPSHVMFVFATTEPLKVPETILSRTQRFDFKRVSVVDMAANLKRIADSEKLEIDDAALTLLARKADGSVRDSLSLMDQVAAYATTTVGEKEVIEALGLVDRRFLMAFVEAVGDDDDRRALKLTNEIIEGGIDVHDFVAELLEHLRVLLVLSTDPEAGESLAYTGEEVQHYAAQASQFSAGDILRLMKVATDLKRDLRSGIEERLALQVAAVKMSRMEATVNLTEVLARLEQGEFLPATSTPAGKKKPAKPVVPAPTGNPVTFVAPPRPAKPAQAKPTVDISEETIREGWAQYLKTLASQSKRLHSLMELTQVVRLDAGRLVLSFPAAGAMYKQAAEK
ncbi:DNA polymerase III subunit gamma/tau, partial [candidate division GN15 bacterium]|nr:DNA polymerase III subunit gamma/tau [candidate division GN15 bacterium]